MMGGGTAHTPTVRFSDSYGYLVNSDISNIGQFDGMNSTSSSDVSSINDTCDSIEYPTDDEIEPDMSPISITPVKKPNKRQQKVLKASSLPLVTLMNARSL